MNVICEKKQEKKTKKYSHEDEEEEHISVSKRANVNNSMNDAHSSFN